MMDREFLAITGGLVGFVLALVGLALWDMNRSERAWAEFSYAHNCKVIGQMTGGYKTGPKTGYRCDDGMEYWR